MKFEKPENKKGDLGAKSRITTGDGKDEKAPIAKNTNEFTLPDGSSINVSE